MARRSSQLEYDVRCEWGRQGIEQLATASDVVVIVDVFSFTTSVDIAAARGATIYPYPWRDDSAAAFAVSVGAELAEKNETGLSLKPSSLENIPAGCRLVLPSPNGSSLSTLTGAVPTLAGCLRNSYAVAEAARQFGARIAVVPAGERWPDGSLRPCFEDQCGAGAILRHLAGSFSPEARAAVAVFERAAPGLAELLRACESGQEKEQRGLARDIELAAELDISGCVPQLRDGAYRGSDPRGASREDSS